MTQETVASTSDAVLDREETISRDELEALQLSRLQHTVAYAYDRVPLYKRKFDETGVHPTDLRELSDLATGAAAGELIAEFRGRSRTISKK
jgi:phenylacetate-CoA ligase